MNIIMNLGASVLAAALIVNTAPPAEAGQRKEARMATTERIKVITHNIAGGAFFGGSMEAFDSVNTQIEAFAPDVVFMQEVCYTGQYLEFKASRPTWSMRFALSRAEHPGCGDGVLGTVIASRHEITNGFTYHLPYWSHGREQRILAGDITVRGVKVLIATVHLKVKWAADESEAFNKTNGEQLGQVQEVANRLASFQPRGPVIVGGDFNTPMHSGAIGPMKPNFNEVNEGGVESTGRIDHIWYAGRHTTGHSGSIVSGGGSDHPIVRGSVKFIP